MNVISRWCTVFENSLRMSHYPALSTNLRYLCSFCISNKTRHCGQIFNHTIFQDWGKCKRSHFFGTTLLLLMFRCLYSASFCSAWRLHGLLLSLKVSGGERETGVLVQLCHVQKSRCWSNRDLHSPLLTASWEEHSPACCSAQCATGRRERLWSGWIWVELERDFATSGQRIEIERTKKTVSLYFYDCSLFFTAPLRSTICATRKSYFCVALTSLRLVYEKRQRLMMALQQPVLSLISAMKKKSLQLYKCRAASKLQSLCRWLFSLSSLAARA